MPSLTLSDRLIWFAHCPKAGGTSVEQFMVAEWGERVGHLHWGWDLWWRGGGWRLATPPNSPQHLIWQDALAGLERAPDVVFAVVRDPVARLASEHRWQTSGRRGTYLGKALARLPFSIWLRVMLRVARWNPHAFDNHLRPQIDFVPDHARVFRLEDGLGPVTDWLCATAGTVAAETPVPHAIPSGPSSAIRREDAALIAQAFAADYARFGYVPHVARVRFGAADALAGLLAPWVALLDRCGRL